MKCRGNFKFKGLQKREGGTFTNDKGQQIPYKESYSLKVDEMTEEGIYERVFKLATDSPLIEQLLTVKPYTDITFEFDINFYGTGIKIVPVGIVK